MTHFLDIDKSKPEALRGIINTALEMKQARVGLSKGTLDADQPLSGQMVALIFEKPSTRTRVSFDVGVRQMGGQTMLLSGTDMQLGHGETIADTARVLSRYVDLIMIRTFEEATLLEMADFATVPVINGLTNKSHPCQIMASLLTIIEKFGDLQGKILSWFGEPNNVLNSLIVGSSTGNIFKGIFFGSDTNKEIQVFKSNIYIGEPFSITSYDQHWSNEQIGRAHV